MCIIRTELYATTHVSDNRSYPQLWSYLLTPGKRQTVELQSSCLPSVILYESKWNHSLYFTLQQQSTEDRVACQKTHIHTHTQSERIDDWAIISFIKFNLFHLASIITVNINKVSDSPCCYGVVFSNRENIESVTQFDSALNFMKLYWHDVLIKEHVFCTKHAQ